MTDLLKIKRAYARLQSFLSTVCEATLDFEICAQAHNMELGDSSKNDSLTFESYDPQWSEIFQEMMPSFSSTEEEFRGMIPFLEFAFDYVSNGEPAYVLIEDLRREAALMPISGKYWELWLRLTPIF